MELFTSIAQQLAAVRQLLGEVPEASAIPQLVRELSDNEVLEVLESSAAMMRSVERLQLAASGVVAERSTRASGHSGLAQSRGFRNPASLVQQITGATRSASAREVRVGEAMLEATSPAFPECAAGASNAGADAGATSAADAQAPQAWHAPLGRALLDGTLSSPQHDAIFQGLGEPPVPQDQRLSFADRQLVNEAAREAWRLAAEELVGEAQVRTVEELRQAARTVRDILDPVGAEQRAQARYEARSFRLWRDAAGTFRGSFTFDDEAGAWVRHLIDAALRPRRGGPRFVDPSEQARAQALVDDPRTNDQLTHDLLIDVLRSGTTADAAQVMGARLAGVRVVRIIDTDAESLGDNAIGSATGSAGSKVSARVPGVGIGAGVAANDDSSGIDTPASTDTGASGLSGSDMSGSGTAAAGLIAASAPGAGSLTTASGIESKHPECPVFLEEEGIVLSTAAARRQACETGSIDIDIDRNGNPLNVGREQRLFTSKQRIALSLRDGGCRWIDCDRSASYCEAHHIDEWAADRGRTDIDRGILLCRFHHMQLHNGGWRITRVGTGPFVLQGREGQSVELPVRTARTAAWNFSALTPPTARFRTQIPHPAAATSTVSTAPSVESPRSEPCSGPPADPDRERDPRQSQNSNPSPSPSPSPSPNLDQNRGPFVAIPNPAFSSPIPQGHPPPPPTGCISSPTSEPDAPPG